jgi:O-antigen/teichoic acid export membrane protein
VAPAEHPGARSVARNTFLLTLARVIDRLTGLVLVLLMAPLVGVEGIGVYGTAFAMFAVISIAASGGTTNYLVREISKRPDLTGTYTVHVALLALGLAIPLTIAAELVVPHLGYSDQQQTGLGIILLAIVPKVLSTVQEAVLVAHGRVHIETATRLAASLGYIAAAVVLLRSGQSIVSVLAAYVVVEVLVTVIYFVVISRRIARLNLSIQASRLRSLASEMRPFVASSGLAALFARPEIVILSLVASQREVGLYSAAVRVAEVPLFMADVLMANILPVMSRAYRRDEERFQAWHIGAVRLILGYGLPITAFLVVGASPIIDILYGVDFEDAVPILQIVALNAGCQSLVAVYTRTLPARGRQDMVVTTLVLAITTRLTLGLALAILYGAVGAAAAALLATVVHVALLARASASLGVPTRLVRIGWRFAVAAGASGAVLSLAADWIGAWPAFLLAAAVYVTVAVLSGAVTRADRQLVRALMSRGA